MQELLTFVMMSFTAYRLARLIILDNIWGGTRDRLFAWLTGGKKLSAWKLKLHELLTCPFCVTVWTSGVVTLAVWWWSTLWLPFLWWGGASVGALLTWGIIDDDD